MTTEDSFEYGNRWLGAWRTTSACINGGLGLLCALEPIIMQIQQTREETVSLMYGSGGRRAKRVVFGDSSLAGGAAPLGFGHSDCNRCSAETDERSIPALEVRRGTASSSEGVLCGRDRSKLLAIPRIRGFSSVLHQWDLQGTTPSAKRGMHASHRRRVEESSSRSLKYDDDEKDTIPVGDQTARPICTGRHCHSVNSSFTDAISSSSARDVEEEEEDEANSEDNLEEDGHLACVPGDVLQNRYLLLRLLECGHNSRIWLAVDLDQCSMARRRLLRELDDQQVRMHFSLLNRPLFVAIKVYRCGTMYQGYAEHEFMMLTYVKELQKVNRLQQLVSLPPSTIVSPEVPLSESPRVNTSDCGTPVTYFDDRRSSVSHYLSNIDEMTSVPLAGRITSARDHFTHSGSFGPHHCIVMNLVGPSVNTVINERGFQGVSENVTRKIIRSTLQNLSLLSAVYVIHGDIRPENLLFMELREDVAENVKTFLSQHFEGFLPIGLDSPGVRSRVVTGNFTESVEREGTEQLSRSPSKYMVTTPLAVRDQESQYSTPHFLQKQHMYGPYNDGPYSVQLSDFALSLIVPPQLRCFYGTPTNDCTAYGGDIKAAVDDGSYDVENRQTGRSYSVHTVQKSDTSLSTAPVSNLAVFGRFSPYLEIPSPLACVTSAVSDLERSLLAQQRYQRGLILQSRVYRSPEIILGKDFNTAVDIWSLGCLAFELLVGRFLFDPVNEINTALELYNEDKTCQREQEHSLTGEIGLNISNTDKITDAGELFNPFHFSEHEKNVDICHLRSIIFLLGPPSPGYILSTPMGAYIKDFFDSNGYFIFLTKSERLQLYGHESDESNGHDGVWSSHFREGSEEKISVGISGQHWPDSSTLSISQGVTSAWLSLEKEIQELISVESAAAFQHFLLKCLQWDPEKRHSAQLLLQEAWLLSAESTTSVPES